ncbi:MAG: DUF302 domain-containing protein [Chromatiales bacterium]|nr:DUF302 domain-containing protein [Chromatiales bacterium]
MLSSTCRTILAIAALALAFINPARGGAPALDIDQTVIKMPVEDGITMDDVVQSMKLRANNLNFKMVGHQPLYLELQAMGLESKRIEIFQFCDARIAKTMIDFNTSFSAYLPCRITLLEDENGKPWLITMNLEMFIASANLSPELHKNAVQVRDTIKSIMEAGAAGDL